MSTLISSGYTPQKMFQKGVERGLQKGKVEGRQEGRAQTVKEFVLNMLKAGMSIEQIADITELSIQQVRALQNGKI